MKRRNVQFHISDKHETPPYDSAGFFCAYSRNVSGNLVAIRIELYRGVLSGAVVFEVVGYSGVMLVEVGGEVVGAVFF